MRERLRSATVRHHERVDRDLGTMALGDVAGYTAFLAITASALIPVERALESAGIASMVPDWPERTRVAALRADLAMLGAEPREIPVPPLAGEAKALGAVYVLEGSRLGAQILLRRVAENEDRRIRSATRYLGHGAGRKLWPSFLAMLEAAACVRAAPDEAIEGSVAVFDAFERALSARSVNVRSPG